MSKNCITPEEIKEQVKGLEKKFGVTLGFIENLNQVEDIEKYIDTLSNLKNLRKKDPAKVEEIKQAAIDILTQINEFAEENPAPVKKNKFYVSLKSGSKDKDTVKGFSQFDINEFAEMFNSAFISLYNSESLLKLLEKEENVSKVTGEFINKPLADILKKFLFQIDETTGQRNFTRINSIKKVFRNEDTPFKNYEKNDATKLFYVEEVFPLMVDFLHMYYREHFQPNIFLPQYIKAKEGNAQRSNDELVRINPEFGLISKNKDILVGTHLAFFDLMTELSKEDYSSEEKVKIINNSEFNKVANRLMEFFRYNDSSFGGMQDANSESINNENATDLEDENNKEASNNDKITREGFATSGNERSGFESASTETRTILSSLFDIDKDAIKTDMYGLPILLNEFNTFKKLSKILRGKIDYEEFYDILKKNEEELPFIKQLLMSYLPIDPSEDIDNFFNNPKYTQQKRQYLQRVKQAFLQDLTKDRFEAIEINLTVKRKWKDGKPYEVITTQVNRAKQKKGVTIRLESTTRFHQKYFKNKAKAFGETLVDSNELIKIEAIIKAALKFKELQKLSIKDQKMEDVLDVLAVFGIVPSDNIKARVSIKQLLSTAKGGKSIDSLFDMLPLKEFTNFTQTFEDINKVEVSKILNNLQNNILNIIKSFDGKNSEEILAELNSEGKFSGFLNLLKINNKIGEETNDIITESNVRIEKLVKDYVAVVSDIFKDKKIKSLSKINNLVKANSRELLDNVNREVEYLNKKTLSKSLSKYKGENVKKFINETLLKLSDPMVQLKDSLDGLYKAYYKLEEDYVLEDDGITDFNKKPRHLIQSLNNLKIKENDLNNKNPKLLVRFPELDPTKNPLIASSLLFNQLYQIDANGNIKPNDQSKMKVNINNILGISLKSQAINSGGLSINNQYEQDNLLSSILLLLFNGNEESNNVDKEAAYNIQFTNIPHSLYLKNNAKVSQTNDFLPIPSYIIANLFNSVIEENYDRVNDVKKISKSLIYANNEQIKKGIEPISEIFKNYLTHYLLMYYKIEKGDLQYVKKEYQNLGSNYKELGLFEKDSSKDPENYIISSELKNLLKEKVEELELEGKSLKEMTNAINGVIDSVVLKNGNNGYVQFQEDLINHFQRQVENGLETLKYSKNYEELDNIIKMFKGDATEKKNSKLPYAKDFSNISEGKVKSKIANIESIAPDNISMLRGLLMTYVVNYEILSQEKLLMFYGDPMFLKASSYIKRASSPGSTGSYALLDYWDILYYNHPDNTSAFAFAKALNKKLIAEGKTGLDMDLHKLDFKYRYGQVEDNNIKSAVYNQLLDGFIHSFKLRFGDKFTEDQIKAKAKQALISYNKLNEADGYGVITLDWYKIFSELTNTWSQEQDDVYNKLAAGETVPYSLLSVTFPVRKFQYTGSIFKDDKQIPADGLHKFSLAPILPGANNNLQTKNENLIKEGKAYEIFASANKKENLLNESGEKDYFYDGSDQSKRVIEKLEAKLVDGKMVYDSGRKSLYAITNLLKDQVHIDTEVKNKVILARQLKRIGKTDLFENGVPIDFKGSTNDTFTTVEEWNKLTDKQKREKSPIFRTYRGIVDNINSIIGIEEKVIFEKLGLQAVQINDRQISISLIPGEGRKKLIETLKKELQKRVVQQKSGSANAYIRLMSIEAKEDDVELEAFVNQKTLKSIIKNIIDKETKFRKFNGSNLVQAPVTGMESATFSSENISVDQTGYLKTYRFGAEINKKEIESLEKEKETKLKAAKTAAEEKEITKTYDSKIAELKETSMAEIMVTFTREWEHLLNLEYKGNEIGSLENLNNILRTDKEWVKQNKNKLTMLAVRIPIQDPNSIEAFIIKEFLPASAGAKIVVPSEIVAKSGGDFDIDKLMVYYYNADKETGEIMFDNTSKGLENKIVKGYLDLLLIPEMFYKLVTANSIAVLKDESRDDSDTSLGTEVVDVLNHYIGKSILTYDNTDLRMPLFNVKQKTILQIAKKLLGHAATIRSNFEELKHAGLLLSADYDVVLRKYLDKKEVALINNPKLVKEIIKSGGKKESKIRFPFKMEDGTVAYNQSADGKVNVSESFNKDNVSITEIISAIMNGLVDVASKPWIVIFSMNEELTSYNFLMLLAGVPANIVFKVNNQKIIQDYIGNKLELKQSLYKRALTKNRSQQIDRLLVDTFNNIIDDFTEFKNNRKVLDESKIKKLKEVFRSLGASDEIGKEKYKFIFDYLDTYILTDNNKKQRPINQLIFKTNIESFLFDLQNNLTESQFLNDSDLTKTLGKSYNQMMNRDLANQIKLLASTLFMKPVGEGLTRALEAIDYDKSQSEYIHDEYTKKTNLSAIKRQGFFDKESFERLQNLHIAAPYNLSNLTIAAAEIVAPLTENKNINKFAISLSKLLKNNRFINPEKQDSVITAFKTDFINYIVQNFGTIKEYDADGNITSNTNIVEYAIKNGIFVDKKIMSSSGKEYSSNKLEDRSLANQLFTLLKTFDTFGQLNVFSNYITPTKGKKIENENQDEDEINLDFIYKIGRVFKNLSPSELDDYNKEIKVFANNSFKMTDVLYAMENNTPEILEQYLSSDTITFEEVFQQLSKLKNDLNLVEFSDIPNAILKQKEPEIYKFLTEFKNNANKIKNKVAELLPYLSLLQSTSSYSSFSIANLFINDNYKIAKDAIKNVKVNVDISDRKQMVELLQNFTVPFLLNNIQLLRTDKRNELLKIVAGKDYDSGKGNDFKKNKIINNASYFTNYYTKEFNINDPNTNFDEAKSILESIKETGLSDSFIFDFLRLKASKILDDKDTMEGIEVDESLLEDENEGDSELFGYENEFADFEGGEEDNVFNNVTLSNGNTYVVDPNTEEVRDLNNKIKKGKIRYEVLVNYYSNMEQLEMASMDDTDYYIAGSKIISDKFSIVENLKQDERDAILAKAIPHTIIPC